MRLRYSRDLFIYFCTLSSEINIESKKIEWEHVVEAVNAVGSENHTVNNLNKQKTHQQGVARTGVGSGVDNLTLLEQRVCSFEGDAVLTRYILPVIYYPYITRC